MRPNLSDRAAWYQSEVRAHDRTLVSPMGSDRERNERAAVEIARTLYAGRFGEPVPPRCPFRCDWTKNRHGQAVIQAVRFIRAGVYCDAIELPGWQGRPLPVEREEPGLF